MSAAATLNFEPSATWESSFLDWFAQRDGSDLFEFERSLGGFRYHQFISRSESSLGRSCMGFGRSQNRAIAAVKCAAESIERQTMVEYFAKAAHAIPAEIQNSNGWSVHQTATLADQAAKMEATERHLLLKAYLTYGWNGFDLIQVISHSGVDLYFLRSIFETHTTSAGLVVAKSKNYTGISVGQCAGLRTDVEKFSFWENAVFEAIDQLLTLDGKPIDIDSAASSWIDRRAKHLLENNFDVRLLGKNGDRFVEPDLSFNVLSLDLSSRFKTGFPLFASFAQSPSANPLFPSDQPSADQNFCRSATPPATGPPRPPWPPRFRRGRLPTR